MSQAVGPPRKVDRMLGDRTRVCASTHPIAPGAHPPTADGTHPPDRPMAHNSPDRPWANTLPTADGTYPPNRRRHTPTRPPPTHAHRPRRRHTPTQPPKAHAHPARRRHTPTDAPSRAHPPTDRSHQQEDTHQEEVPRPAAPAHHPSSANQRSAGESVRGPRATARPGRRNRSTGMRRHGRIRRTACARPAASHR